MKLDGWVSGLNHWFAKPTQGEIFAESSNLSSSAVTKY